MPVISWKRGRSALEAIVAVCAAPKGRRDARDRRRRHERSELDWRCAWPIDLIFPGCLDGCFGN